MSKDTKKNNIIQKNEKNNIHYFNILAHDDPQKINSNVATIDKLRKRARAKNFTNYYLKYLANTESKLHKSYIKTFSCSNVLHQLHNKITSRYCKQRWCIVCNRIKIATLINSYSSSLAKLKDDLYFVTLTIRNVKADELKNTISYINKVFSKILRKFRKKNIKVKLIKKIEVTYNPDRDDYHPHLHLLINGKKHAKFILENWLKYNNSNAVNIAQDIRQSDGNYVEIFKYLSKIITNRSIHIKPLNTIYEAMKNLKTVQAINIKKQNNNIYDFNNIVTEIIKDINEVEAETWIWHDYDWYSLSNNISLTGNKQNELTKQIKIKNF